ncbi:MAG: protein kinase [Elusimicrobia bacterium]|nr:protein kinase [Elusimicrobiota bacterium]
MIALALGLRRLTAADFLGRGFAAERAGDFEQAHRDAAKALELEPENANARELYHLTAGRSSRLALGLGGEAVAAAKAAAAGAQAAGGAAAQDSGAALSAADQTVLPRGGSTSAAGAQNPSRWTQEAGRSLELGDLAGVIASAGRALEIEPANVEARNLRAMARERSGDHRGAVEDATEALRVEPSNVRALNTRAWSLSGMRYFSEALDDATRAATAAPNDALSFEALGRAQGGLKRRVEMIDSLTRAARLDQRFAPTLQAAIQLPSSEDTELLFLVRPGMPLFPPAMPPRREPRAWIPLLWTLSGGLLIALGLFRLLSPGWLGRATTALRRVGVRSTPPEARPSGRFWDYYTFTRVIASGGMGIVYEAVDRSLKRRVAVKQMRGDIRDDPREREAFIKEARVVAGLKHPGIVEVYSIIEDGPDLYLVFEFVPGRTLHAMLQEQGKLGLKEAVILFRGICAAVQHAHERGIIHRDLKPSNVMVTPDGSPKVMDFGLARFAPEGGAVVTKTVAGTPAYMAPEADQGHLRKESDVFSLGVCLYETATGRLPFEGPSGTVLLDKLAGRFDLPSRRAPGLPAGFDAAMARALTPDPAARFASPGELYASIDVFGR